MAGTDTGIGGAFLARCAGFEVSTPTYENCRTAELQELGAETSPLAAYHDSAECYTGIDWEGIV